MDRWTFEAMRQANEEWRERERIRLMAERLGISLDEAKARREAEVKAEDDAWWAERKRRHAIWKPKQDAALARLGEYVGLGVPLGICRRRRSDSHAHLVAMATVTVGKNTVHVDEKPATLCSGRTHIPGNIDLADDEDGPEEWIRWVSCPRCRRIAEKARRN